MMTQLVTLMYHRVHDPINELPTDNFKKHLLSLVEQYNIVCPKDKLSNKKLNICLTFDDAYCDFYSVVYPLLLEYNVKAILAVSPAYIQEQTTLPMTQRLQVPYPKGMEPNIAQSQVPFCTWQELKQMQQSGHVIIASHGFEHASLASPKANLKKEIISSKKILEEKLNTQIDYFIYPYGDFTRKNHRLVTKHYQLGFRIGSASNPHFSPNSKMIYRVDADHLWMQNKDLEPILKKLKRKYWLNRLRFK